MLFVLSRVGDKYICLDLCLLRKEFFVPGHVLWLLKCKRICFVIHESDFSRAFVSLLCGKAILKLLPSIVIDTEAMFLFYRCLFM